MNEVRHAAFESARRDDNVHGAGHAAGLRQAGGGVDAEDRPASDSGRDLGRDSPWANGPRTLPAAYVSALFPTTGPMPIVLDTVTTLGVVFFLLTAGLEIDLRSIFRQGKSALLVSFFGVVFPFAAGFLAAKFFLTTWARKRAPIL